jgi:hypothetical protein
MQQTSPDGNMLARGDDPTVEVGKPTPTTWLAGIEKVAGDEETELSNAPREPMSCRTSGFKKLCLRRFSPKG